MGRLMTGFGKRCEQTIYIHLMIQVNYLYKQRSRRLGGRCLPPFFFGQMLSYAFSWTERYNSATVVSFIQFEVKPRIFVAREEGF